ncbi:MAG: T9SS type A sorting domain-containing protein [Bacteroidetes bacterium]|nr:T9SS type A sorting domain-containing protein [Bacteroidota bacterium]
MKNILLYSVFTLMLASTAVGAQTITYCGIWIDYDAAGNRVFRYPGCKTFDNSHSNPNVPTPPISARMIKNTVENNSDVVPLVSPNPSSGKYQIYIQNNEDPGHFEWYSLSGQLIDQGSFTTPSYQGDLSVFPPGNYFLKISLHGKSFMFKITKE